MHIDWITVVAQIINFLILVWLLQRFLYRPIVDAMDGREKRIAARLREASEREAAAGEEIRAYRQRQAQFDEEKGALLARAEDDLRRQMEHREQAARQEVARLRAQWLQQVDEERTSFLHDMRQRSAAHVLALSRRVLADLADIPLEEQMMRALARHLEALAPTDLGRLRQAARDAGGRIIVRSRFVIDPQQRPLLTGAIRRQIAPETDAMIEWTTDPAMTGGIALVIGNHSLDWTLDHWLDELEHRLGQELDARSGTPGPLAGEVPVSAS